MPGRDDELVARMLEVVEEVAVEEVLAALLEANHRVELGRGLVGQDRAEEVDVRGRHFHVHEKVRAVGREQDREVGVVHQQRVEVEPSLRVVLDRHDERIGVDPVDDAADDVCGLVPDERRGQHLDLVVRLEPERPRKPAADRR